MNTTTYLTPLFFKLFLNDLKVFITGSLYIRSLDFVFSNITTISAYFVGVFTLTVLPNGRTDFST